MVSNHLILDGLDGLRWFRKNVRFLMEVVILKNQPTGGEASCVVSNSIRGGQASGG